MCGVSLELIFTGAAFIDNHCPTSRRSVQKSQFHLDLTWSFRRRRPSAGWSVAKAPAARFQPQSLRPIRGFCCFCNLNLCLSHAYSPRRRTAGQRPLCRDFNRRYACKNLLLGFRLGNSDLSQDGIAMESLRGQRCVRELPLRLNRIQHERVAVFENFPLRPRPKPYRRQQHDSGARPQGSFAHAIDYNESDAGGPDRCPNARLSSYLIARAAGKPSIAANNPAYRRRA